MTIDSNKQAAEADLGVHVGGVTPDQVQGGDLTKVPMWKIRWRLLKRSAGTTWGLFSENKMGVFGLSLIGLFAVMAIIHPILMSTVWDPRVYDPVDGYDAVMTEYTVIEGEPAEGTFEISLNEARIRLNPTIKVGESVSIPTQPAPPTLTGETPHYLGTDSRGRDILSQLLFSTRAAFFLGAVAAITTVLIATTVGAIAAYFGGWIDGSLMRFADLILLMPLLPVLILLSAMLEITMITLGIMIGVLSGFGGVAIVLKSQALAVKVKSYIDAARVAGGSDWHVIFRHIVPNVLPLSFLFMMFGVTEAIAIESTLSFFGLLNVDMTWGLMIEGARTNGYLLSGTSYWWLLFPAGLAVSFLCFAFFLVGRGMDEVINPRLRAR